jgi:hypothetical protein
VQEVRQRSRSGMNTGQDQSADLCFPYPKSRGRVNERLCQRSEISSARPGTFSTCLRSIDSKGAMVELRQGDRKSLAAAVEHIEKMIDDELERLLGRAQAPFIAKDLKKRRIASLRKRFRSLVKAPEKN